MKEVKLSMQRILYLGTNSQHFEQTRRGENVQIVHYPVITLIPRSIDHEDIREAFSTLDQYTHIFFTSKNAVRIFFDDLSMLKRDPSQLHNKIFIAIGPVTAHYLAICFRAPDFTAQIETQEGLILLLKKIPISHSSRFLFPHSSLSRNALVSFFKQNQIRYFAFDLYDTVFQKPAFDIDLASIDEIIFTSPSTVQGFLHIFGSIPKDKKLYAQGPITRARLLNHVQHKIFFTHI